MRSIVDRQGLKRDPCNTQGRRYLWQIFDKQSRWSGVSLNEVNPSQSDSKLKAIVLRGEYWEECHARRFHDLTAFRMTSTSFIGDDIWPSLFYRLSKRTLQVQGFTSEPAKAKIITDVAGCPFSFRVTRSSSLCAMADDGAFSSPDSTPGFPDGR